MPLLSHHDPTQLGFNDHYCIEIMHTNIIRKLLLATVFNTRTPYLVSPPPVYSPHFLDSYFLNRDSTNWIPKKWQMVSHHPQKKKKKAQISEYGYFLKSFIPCPKPGSWPCLSTMSLLLFPVLCVFSLHLSPFYQGLWECPFPEYLPFEISFLRTSSNITFQSSFRFCQAELTTHFFLFP